jgi:phage terminase Nu1 subunit (DNA packaging protein)
MSKADEIISLKQAAEVLGYSKPWIGKLVEDGFITKVAVGKYKLGNVVQGALAAAKQVKQSAPQSANKERVLKARADGMELKNKIDAKELIYQEDAFALLATVLGGLKTELIGLPAQVTRDPTIRKSVRDAIDGVLQRASDRCEKSAAKLRSGMLDMEDDHADDE